MPAVSPKKATGRDSSPVRSSAAKPKVILENLQRPPLVPRDGLGQFVSLQPYLKIMDTCRSAYTNYQVGTVFCPLILLTHVGVAKSPYSKVPKLSISCDDTYLVCRCLWQQLEKTSSLVFCNPLTTWPPSCWR